MRILRSLIACLTLALALGQMTPAEAATVRVYAAASLNDALQEIASAYQSQSGDIVRFNFAASSFLARQIEEGAPADIFFSADEAKMDALEKRGLIVQKSRVSLLSNSLVMVVARAGGPDIRSPQDLAADRVKRVALAETRTVPAGIYARAYLQKVNLWSRIEAKVIPTDNVRAALAAVEAGNADAAIVYKTDAAISKRVKVAYAVPADESPAISYPAALIKSGDEPEAARRFLDYLKSPAASRAFERLGFVPNE